RRLGGAQRLKLGAQAGYLFLLLLQGRNDHGRVGVEVHAVAFLVDAKARLDVFDDEAELLLLLRVFDVFVGRDRQLKDFLCKLRALRVTYVADVLLEARARTRTHATVGRVAARAHERSATAQTAVTGRPLKLVAGGALRHPVGAGGQIRRRV